MSEHRAIFYRGKNIEECSREELIAAIRWYALRLDEEKDWGAKCRDLDRAFVDTAMALAQRRV